MADEENKVPENSGETNNTTPNNSQTENKPVEKTPESTDLPKKFEGKTTEEILKAYGELERKMGEMSGKVGEVEKLQTTLKDWEALGMVIKNNPVLLRGLEEALKSPDAPTETKKDDVRQTLESNAIGAFEAKYGINNLSSEDAQKLRTKVGSELRDMLDTDGTKTVEQIMADIPLNKLPVYLEKAYKLATADDEKEKARIEAIFEDRQNLAGQFASIPSSGGKSDGVQLTEEQRNVAKKLNISEEQYKKQLAKDQE